MRNSQRPCHLIQEDIACNRELGQEDNQHVLSCSSCSDVAVKVAELDSLVRKVFDQEIPLDFADRVVAKIWEEESQSDNLYSQWLPFLERIAYSRAIQWLLVGVGSVFGLFKIFRFFLVHGFI
ncbi:MAG: hypothetical protein OEY18_11180 [Candidatus Aminicenantes bacterium]|nr:hypothetical protein [Candidatus Aminicenantes bacterium]MDH5385260.1 hypothetical protein [Candidatus Aminicenantes bacterium]